VRRYLIYFEKRFPNGQEGKLWLVVREALDGDWDELIWDGWEARYEFAARNGEPVLTHTELKPRNPRARAPEGGITARLLHNKVKIPDAYAAARAYLARLLELLDDGNEAEAIRYALAYAQPDKDGRAREEERALQRLAEWKPEADKWHVRAAGYLSVDTLQAPRRPGRRGRPDLFYAEFASEYVEIAKTTPHATAELARRRDYDPRYVRDLLNQARNRGLLTRPPSGRAGGTLTPKAIALLSPERRHLDGATVVHPFQTVRPASA
jgi:hypothetical protein